MLCPWEGWEELTFSHSQEKGPECLERQEGVRCSPPHTVCGFSAGASDPLKEGSIVDTSPSSPRVPSYLVSILSCHQMAVSLSALLGLLPGTLHRMLVLLACLMDIFHSLLGLCARDRTLMSPLKAMKLPTKQPAWPPSLHAAASLRLQP